MNWAQGRAEAAMVALNCAPSESTDVRVGYRIVEGGANGAQVFIFARIGYGLLGKPHNL